MAKTKKIRRMSADRGASIDLDPNETVYTVELAGNSYRVVAVKAKDIPASEMFWESKLSAQDDLGSWEDPGEGHHEQYYENPRKPKITFSNMENQPDLGTGHIGVYVDGVPRGEILKESDLTSEAGDTDASQRRIRPSEFTIETYIVGYGEQGWDGNWQFETEFQVSDYDGARAALSAAKQWVRDELSYDEY
tara:strand:- start:4264 stop:4839 length:576 start_codon:yes stop_codon:yes gene_type:complete